MIYYASSDYSGMPKTERLITEQRQNPNDRWLSYIWYGSDFGQILYRP